MTSIQNENTPPPVPTGELSTETNAIKALEVVEPSGESLPGAAPQTDNAGTNAEGVQSAMDTAKAWGWWFIEKCEVAGELIAGVLGLDESRYQWVINNMTEEDWKIAKRVEARRQAQLAGRPYEDMEGGATPEAAIVPPAAPTSSVEDR